MKRKKAKLTPLQKAIKNGKKHLAIWEITQLQHSPDIVQNIFFELMMCI